MSPSSSVKSFKTFSWSPKGNPSTYLQEIALVEFGANSLKNEIQKRKTARPNERDPYDNDRVPRHALPDRRTHSQTDGAAERTTNSATVGATYATAERTTDSATD